MFAAISRYEEAAETPAPLRLERGDGAAEIVFARREDGCTAIAHLYQRTPCRILFPAPAPGDLTLAALLTTSGGLTGGDCLRLDVRAEAAARAIVTTAAAEKIYRSAEGDVEIAVTLTVAEGGWLEWLPQETILFDRARLERHLSVAVAADARFLGAEMLVFGRAARGERFTRGRLFESWRIRFGEALVWADALSLEDDVAAALAAPAGFAGAGALATAVYVGADAAAHLPLARALAEEGGCRGGATLLGPVLLARFLDPRAEIVRAALARYVAGLRHAAAGLPATLPRLWGI
jgi:urease accessory protein